MTCGAIEFAHAYLQKMKKLFTYIIIEKMKKNQISMVSSPLKRTWLILEGGKTRGTRGLIFQFIQYLSIYLQQL